MNRKNNVLPFPKPPEESGTSTIIAQIGSGRFAIHIQVEDLPPALPTVFTPKRGARSCFPGLRNSPGKQHADGNEIPSTTSEAGRRCSKNSVPISLPAGLSARTRLRRNSAATGSRFSVRRGAMLHNAGGDAFFGTDHAVFTLAHFLLDRGSEKCAGTGITSQLRHGLNSLICVGSQSDRSSRHGCLYL
jgi:hypothetical protein